METTSLTPSTSPNQMAHRLKAGTEALAGLDDRSDLSKKLSQILQDYRSPSPPHPDHPKDVKRIKKGTSSNLIQLGPKHHQFLPPRPPVHQHEQ